MPQLLRNLFISYPKAIIRIAIVIVNNIYCIPTYVIWMTLLLPIKRCHPDLYYRVEGLFFHWLLSVVAMWSWTAGYDIVEVGDDWSPCVAKDVRTLIIANHQSTADVPLLMACFSSKPDILPNIMWIMDRVFKFTNFGIVSVIHQDFFIRAGTKHRDATIERLRHHVHDIFVPRSRNYMVLFPEGGFLRKRREVSQRYAEKNNLPFLKNVTLPRIGALQAILDVLPTRTSSGNNNSAKRIENGTFHSVSSQEDIMQYQNKREEVQETQLDYVLDITIAYPQGKPLDLPDIVTGLRPACKTYFIYRLYHSSEVPKGEHALTEWLNDRWIEKEQILEEYYTTGNITIPGIINPPAVVEQDMLRFLIINLFFITSTYFHYKLFYIMYEYCNSYL